MNYGRPPGGALRRTKQIGKMVFVKIPHPTPHLPLTFPFNTN